MDQRNERADYSDLLSAIDERPKSGPYGIEILPNSQVLPPGSAVQIAEHTIGIPKRVLEASFRVAYSVFFETDVSDRTDDNDGAILGATSIMLLFDPEHLTAANTRKEIIQKGISRSSSDSEEKKILVSELFFTEFLLTSKLQRHNKSPTLWHHRKWLIETFDSPSNGIADTLHEHEALLIVSRAADRHPGNYYAFDYLRWWVESRPRKEGTDPMDIWSEKLKLAQYYTFWCLNHTSDPSGWSFLLWAMDVMSVEALVLQADIGQRILDRAMTMGLKNESLWYFLRQNVWLAQSIPKTDFRLEYMKALQKLLRTEPKDSQFRKIVQKDFRDIMQAESGDLDNDY